MKIFPNVTKLQKTGLFVDIIKVQRTKEDRKMSAINVTNTNFGEIIKSEKPVLLDFYASWCGPCRMVLPIVDEIARENPQFNVVKVNVDEHPQLAEQFDVMSVPTLIVMKNGQITNRATGARPKARILELLA